MANMYIGDQALGTVAVVLNTADATATAADIMKDKIAYVGNEKVVGTHECEPAENLDSELATQDAKIAELQAALQGKAAVASEDLDAEMTAQDEAIASQDDLIAQIVSALDGKTGASDGTSVETCTVTLSDCMVDTRVICTKLVDGVIISCSTLEGGTTYTDVVCGSTVFVYDEGSDLVPTTVSGDATVLETNILNGAGNVYLVNGDCTINMERYVE